MINLSGGEKVKISLLKLLLDEYDISTDDANDKIEEYIKEANRRSEAVSQALAQTGQKVYTRNINDAMYVTDNVKYFLVGPNGKIFEM